MLYVFCLQGHSASIGHLQHPQARQVAVLMSYRLSTISPLLLLLDFVLTSGMWSVAPLLESAAHQSSSTSQASSTIVQKQAPAASTKSQFVDQIQMAVNWMQQLFVQHSFDSKVDSGRQVNLYRIADFEMLIAFRYRLMFFPIQLRSRVTIQAKSHSTAVSMKWAQTNLTAIALGFAVA